LNYTVLNLVHFFWDTV